MQEWPYDQLLLSHLILLSSLFDRVPKRRKGIEERIKSFLAYFSSSTVLLHNINCSWVFIYINERDDMRIEMGMTTKYINFLWGIHVRVLWYHLRDQRSSLFLLSSSLSSYLDCIFLSRMSIHTSSHNRMNSLPNHFMHFIIIEEWMSLRSFDLLECLQRDSLPIPSLIFHWLTLSGLFLTVGDMNENPRNNSWAAAEGGRAGESKERRREWGEGERDQRSTHPSVFSLWIQDRNEEEHRQDWLRVGREASLAAITTHYSSQ